MKSRVTLSVLALMSVLVTSGCGVSMTDEHGWTDIRTRGYSDEIADVVVEAEHPGNYVESLVVDISPGDLYDHVALYATSTCEPGDWYVIAEMRRPGDAPKEQQPVTEHPTAPLSFGFDADGKRRFWDEADD